MRISKNLLRIITVGFIALGSLSFIGCGTKKAEVKKEQKTEVSSEENAKETIDVSTSVSSGYYLALGVLDENVIYDNASRNEAKITVVDGKVLFPQGTVKALAIKSWSRQEKAYNPPQNEIKQYIESLEAANVIKEIPEQVLAEQVRIHLHMIYQNSHGEFQTIQVTDFGDGYHQISVAVDDSEDFSKDISIKSDSGKKIKEVFIQSKSAEKMLKNWLKWEKQGEKGFRLIKSASVLADNGKKQINVSKKDLKLLKKFLQMKKEKLQSPCGYEYHFECILNDGSKFHFSISADGESISTDKGVYGINNSMNEKIIDLLKKINASL